MKDKKEKSLIDRGLSLIERSGNKMPTQSSSSLSLSESLF